MPNNEITVHNCLTGETIVRDMTDNEIAHRDQIIADQQIAAQTAAQKENAKQSARTKLAALGLTEQEIAALIS
jgi:hypothetical protein